MTETDPSAALSAIRERYQDGITLAPEDAPDSVADIPSLLKVAEAVLALHQPHVRRQNWPPVCSYDNRRWPCPEVSAITAALTELESI